MAVYEYQALDSSGSQRTGTIEADSSRQVRQSLRDQRLIPLSVDRITAKKVDVVSEGGITFFSKGASSRQLALITRQLATLLQAAMPLEEALQIAAEQQDKQHLKRVLLAVRSKVLSGHTLAQSLDGFPNFFSKMYRATIAAGEQAGYLDKVLMQLATYTEQQMATKQKIQMALIYPSILVLVAIGIVSFLLGYVIPDVVKVFVDNGKPLPWITELMISLSKSFQQWWFVVVLFIVLWFCLWRYLVSIPSFRLAWHQKLLTMPIIGKFNMMFNTSQFASTLSILVRSSVSLVDALFMAAQVVSNDVIKEAVLTSAKKVREGESLYRALKDCKQFPPLMLHMVASGEATGELSAMLERVSYNQQLDLESKIAIMLGLLEPAILLIMGGMVLSVVIAILLPILGMNDFLI